MGPGRGLRRGLHDRPPRRHAARQDDGAAALHRHRRRPPRPSGRAPTASGASRPCKRPPLEPKALYRPVYGIAAPFRRDPAHELIEKNKPKPLVMDIKGARGLTPYPSKLPLAAKANALTL